MIYDVDGMLPERAFQRDARGHIKPQGGSGGGSAPSNQNVTTTSIPEYARPYVESMLGKAEAATSQPFQAYGGQRTAAFTPMQVQAMQSVSGMQPSQQITDASNMAYQAGQGALGTQQTAAGLQNTALGYGQAGSMYGGAASQFGAAGAQQAQNTALQAQRQAAMYGGQGAQYGGQGMQFGAQGAGIGAQGVEAAQQGFGAGAQYAQQATSPAAQQAYMSPYMQNVVDVQAQEARRQADIARQAQRSQATGAGAFGGSRAAIVEAEGERGLQDRIAQIQAQGSQNAFQQAQQAQQFGANLGLQGLQAGYQGLQTGMQGTAQGIQGAQAGIQGAGLGLQGVGQQIAGGQLGIQGGQLGIQGQEAGMRGAQTGLQGVQAATGAGQYGLQGMGEATRAAGTLGQLGQTEFGQQQAITDAQMRAGAMQREEEQKGLDMLYQQFLAEQNYPMEQLGQFSNILRGLPLNQQTMSQYQNPSGLSQAVGAGTAAYGLYQMGKKEGGVIKEGDGLDKLGLYNAMRKG